MDIFFSGTIFARWPHLTQISKKFFKDYFKENYDTATITDMFGYTHYVKDIELITTDNAMKWIKFNKTYEYWCEWVEDNDCMFGIV